MGLPITKYTLLKAVAEDKDIFYGPSYTQKLNNFRSFKFYGIILHDPTNHQGFHAKLGKEFELLDKLTGENFLFMGLADTPMEWVKKRTYFREYRRVFDQDLPGNRGSDYISEDPSITTLTLTKALNIDYEDLPVILLTDDLRKRRFYVIKTSANTLVEQLSKIGYYCSRTQRPAMMSGPLAFPTPDYPPQVQEHYWEHNSPEKDPAFLTLLKDIDISSGNSIGQIESGLADILSGVLSTLAIKRNALGESWIAKDHLKAFLKAYNSPSPLANPQPDIVSIENKLLALVGLLANISKNPDSDFGFTLHEQCEDESHILIKTFNKVAPSYRELSGKLLHDMDYSPLLICLGKVFEKEFNLSVVHWIRANLGIEMPDYFNKWKNSKENYVLSPSREIVPNPEPVNFNEKQYGKWRAPSIGGSEYIYKSLVHEQKAPEEITDPDLFLDKCRAFRKLRNKTAHEELVSEEDFQNALVTFRYFIDYDKFKQMNMIKAKLKGLLDPNDGKQLSLF